MKFIVCAVAAYLGFLLLATSAAPYTPHSAPSSPAPSDLRLMTYGKYRPCALSFAFAQIEAKS